MPTHSSMHMSALYIHTITVSLLLLVHFLVILPHFTPSLGLVMGKLDHDTYIRHFTHPHPLELIADDHSTQPNNMNTSNVNPVISTYMLCASCKLPANSSDDLTYSCNQCNFHLHLSCTKFPQLITHPSHASHPLKLLPVSTYPGGIFNCDACLRRGNGFCYHCDLCDFDLHVVCASKPLTVGHHLHEHPLMLTFKNPYETKGFSCDICSKIGSKHWLYRCGVCEFDAHLHCATGTLPPPLPPQQSVGRNQFHAQPMPARPSSGISGRMQGNQSYPAMANQPVNKISNGIQTQQSVPETMAFEYTGIGIQMQQSFPEEAGRQNNYYGGIMQRQQSYPVTSGGGMQPHQSYLVTAGGGTHPQQSYPGTGEGGMQRQQSYPLTGVMQQQHYPVTGGGGMQPHQNYLVTGGRGKQPQQTYPVASGGLMNATIQGLVEGAAQQVGQNLMQSLIGGNGGDGSTSSVYVNLGSTYTENQDSSGTQEY